MDGLIDGPNDQPMDGPVKNIIPLRCLGYIKTNLNYMGTLPPMYLTFVFRERLANACNNSSVCLDFGHFLRGKAYSTAVQVAVDLISHARVSCHD